jgi:hypothetical protein
MSRYVGKQSLIAVSTSIVLGFVLVGFSAAQAEGLFDRMVDRASQSAESAISQQTDRTINKSINKLEECLSTDRECIKRAKNQGKEVTIANAPAAPDSVKCMATDPACLKQAKAQGKKVEIVDEEELDVLRCSVSDAACLKRAKSMGKKVEIVD